MPESRVSHLIKRLLEHQLSVDEKDELFSLIDGLDDNELKDYLQSVWDKYEGNTDLSAERTKIVLDNILCSSFKSELKQQGKLIQFARFRKMVVAVCLFFLISGIIYIAFNSSSVSPHSIIRNTQPGINELSNYTRNIILPDGSTVVLHSGSKIDYLSSFSGDTREISLIGEAYFDIVHNAARPFIIHTGKIKTTVLGTAFTIKAYSGQKDIIVSVLRGKVKVENNSGLLAVLTPNTKVNYDIAGARFEQQKVDVMAAVTDWTKQDMIFDGASFGVIAETLSKRYNMSFQFNNPAIVKCILSAGFDGTEPIDKVINILCKIINATYTIQNGIVLIDGQGCE